MTTKIAIIDTSSAIILYKAGLHILLTEVYDIVLPESVFAEITACPYDGSREYKQLAAEQKIRILNRPHREKRCITTGLDRGENDLIQFFYAGTGNFVIIDDGPAARYCTRQGVPFINALLFPVILRIARLQGEMFCRRAMEKVIEAGRYSQKIIDYAASCQTADIAFAIP